MTVLDRTVQNGYGHAVPRPREFDEEQVLDAALRHFWRAGYNATSTEDLCVQTGLGRGSLYNAFHSKRAVYLAALRRYYEVGTARPVAVLEGPEPLRERLRTLMTLVVEADLADPVRRGCFAINAAIELAGSDPEIREMVRRHFERIDTALVDAFTRAHEQGELDPGRDPVIAARATLSSYYGLRVLARAADGRAMLDDIVEGTLAAL